MKMVPMDEANTVELKVFIWFQYSWRRLFFQIGVAITHQLQSRPLQKKWDKLLPEFLKHRSSIVPYLVTGSLVFCAFFAGTSESLDATSSWPCLTPGDVTGVHRGGLGHSKGQVNGEQIEIRDQNPRMGLYYPVISLYGDYKWLY